MVEMEAVRGSLLSSPAEMGLSQPQSRVGWLLGLLAESWHCLPLGSTAAARGLV